jgi:hypothetical protein
MAQAGEQRRRARAQRIRWRLRGAWLWPAFIVLTLLEMCLLHWLPIAGEGTGFVPGLLLAGSLNVIAIALLGSLGGALLRRVRGDLPKVVADNYAGLAGLGVVAVAFVAAGLVHRPELAADRAAFAEQSRAVRLWVQANAGDYARAHVNFADSVRIDTDLYRTCVPSPDPKRWLCLIVDTSHSPPRIKRDVSRESNASQNPRGVYR